MDPERAANQSHDHVQGSDRRDRLLRLHVRAVGQHAGRDRLTPMRLGFFGRRLAMLLASLLIASFVIFGALYLAPGNPIAALSGGRSLPPSSLRVLEARYHLNQPFLAQYWYWLSNALHGNLGISITLRENVSSLIASRIWTTAGL